MLLTTALLLGLAPEPGLRWNAPEGCPTQDDAAAYLRDELQEDPDVGADEVNVEQTDDGWRATVRIDGGDVRELEAAACEDLMAAAMVVISVSRDEPEQATVPAPAPAPLPAPETTPSLEPPPTLDPPPELEPPPPQPEPEPEPEPLAFTHWLSLNAGVAASLLPALSARVTPRYELAAPTWALRLAAHYDTPREILYSDDTVGGRFQAASADLVGCWTPGRRTLTGSLCAGLGGGGVFGIGVGVPSPRRPRAAWVGALASAGLRWAWSERWRLAVDASFTAGIRRPLFHIGDRETLFQSPQLGGAGTIGIERRLR